MICRSRLAELESVDITSEIARRRADFPILQQTVRGKPLVYFDNAATTQKPRAVIDAVSRFYSEDNANVHRGVHTLSERATAAYEEARCKVQGFVSAEHPQEIVFVRGTTEGINLVSQSYGSIGVRHGDEIVISTMEHHANIVPWQMLCRRTGAVLRVIPITDQGELIIDAFERLLNERTRLVSVVHVSNVLGTINPVAEVIARAHARGIPVMVDGAQAVGHINVDVRALNADFYVFSGHKMFGPTGIGVLYGRASLLESMPPWQGGGDMIRSVTFERTEFDGLPGRFEAGTPNIAGAIGLGAAIDYIDRIGIDCIAARERQLMEYATERLKTVPGLHMLGNAPDKAAVLSFVMDNVHPHDVGTVLDDQGIAVRTGHHCCQPLLCRLGVEVASRASLAFYNTKDEIDVFIDGLGRIAELFG